MKHTALKKLASKFIKDFETNPDVQFRFHRFMMYVWVMMGILGLVVLLLFPGFWDKISLLFIYEVSIYANWDTDYDAMSASGAWGEAKKVNRKVS